MEDNREIEVKFLEIDKVKLAEKLNYLGAEDKGESHVAEMIFYDRDMKWKDEKNKFVRIRKTKDGSTLTFKHQVADTVDGTIELEVEVSNEETTRKILEASGLVLYRHQEKKRHKFLLGEVIVDIDTWPKVPTYVEVEGRSEKALRYAASMLGFDWTKAEFGTAKYVIEKHYNIPVSNLKYFTFERIE